MIPIKRNGVSKRRSAKKFRRNVGRSKVLNLRQAPMRGGWRL